MTVIMRLEGGLGNQLFQYAFGRAMSQAKQVPLKLDLTAYQSGGKREFRLCNFSVHCEIADKDEIRQITGANLSTRRKRVFNLHQRLQPYYRRRVVREKRLFVYDASVFLAGPDVLLIGYWQHPLYFEQVTDVLKEELQIRSPAVGKNQRLLCDIENSTSVCIHIRRGDYVVSQHTSQVHGVCPPSYYSEAMAHLDQRAGPVRFFVFSDDIEWARSNLPAGYDCTYVDHNGHVHDYEDLRLMSHCCHHIIANSTFSWWGAWMGQHEGQVVVAPRAWAKKTAWNTEGIYLPDWIRM